MWMLEASNALLTAASCNPLQPTATRCNPLQPTVFHCNNLQHTARLIGQGSIMWMLEASDALLTATHCNTLQHTATHCNICNPLQHTTCNPLQPTATHRNPPRPTATYCNTLQYPATLIGKDSTMWMLEASDASLAALGSPPSAKTTVRIHYVSLSVYG